MTGFRWLIATLALAGTVQAADVDMPGLLREMQEAGASYDPQRLYQLGPRVLETVLDQLLPESSFVSSEPLAPPTELLQRLGDKDYKVREAATQKLIALGPAVRPALEAAACDNDPEVAERAQIALEKIPHPPKPSELPKNTARSLGASCGEAYRIFAEGLTDKAALRVLAMRSLAALQAGRPVAEIPQDILQSSLIALARHGDDEILNTLEPALTLEKEATAVWVVRTIAGALPPKFTPQLLTKARQSQRPAIATEAEVWLRPAGPNARVFHVSSMTNQYFALLGDYSGRFEVVESHLIVWLEQGKIVRVKPGGRASLDRVRCGLATKSGAQWGIPRQGNALPLSRFLENGQELPLAPCRFVIPLEGQSNLADCWLLFEIESHHPDTPKAESRRVVGSSYAHSPHDIFTAVPPAQPVPEGPEK